MNTLGSPSSGFAAPLTRVVMDYVGTQGHDSAPIQQALGLNTDQLADPTQRVPTSRLIQALNVASSLCGDPSTAVRVAQTIRPAHLGALGYALSSSPTVSQAITLYERMHRLICNQSQINLQMRPHAMEITCDWLDGPVPRDTQLWAFISSARLSFSRWVIGRQLVPMQVDLPCPPPGHPQALAALQGHLGCPVHFEAHIPRELLPLEWLGMHMPSADPVMHRMMTSMSDQLLSAHQEGGEAVTVLMRQLIALSLNQGLAPSLEAMLPDLRAAGCTSVRQLQRRLAEQGLSFKELVEQVRKEQVLNDLRHTELPLSVVAQRAAYAEPASFHRAVKRWTGTTPLGVRSQRKPVPGGASNNPA